MNRRGIILAGGTGTRLFPSTIATSKQLLSVFDKPMIYYPLSTLMLADITNILIITTQDGQKSFMKLLGNGSQFGINIHYRIQKKPNGIAEAFLIAEDFIENYSSTLILGDNIFYGHNFESILVTSSKDQEFARIFAYHVNDPERYGVVEFDQNQIPQKIIEKPKNPSSNYAVTGLYFYNNDVVDYAKKIIPSGRGELEITDLNNIYIEENKMKVEILNRGFSWFDTGTPNSLLEASQFVSSIQNRQGQLISSPEEIAYRKGFISISELREYASSLGHNDYSKKLMLLK